MKRISEATDAGQLHAFVAVARAGTVGAAARSLGRTQPSISARIAGLEAAWKTRLFHRRARGMRLTPEGERLLPLAERALETLEDLDREAGLPLAGRAHLRVGAGDALGRELLPAALRAASRADETTQVRIVEGPRERLLDALSAGEIDVALVVDPDREGRRGLQVRPLLRTPVVALLPPEHPAAGRKAIGIATLRGDPLVALQPGSAFRDHLERAWRRAGERLRPAVEVGNFSLVRRYVAAGLGWAAVPAVAFAPQVAGPRLRGVPVLRYAGVTRGGAPLSATTARFVSRLDEAAAALS